MGFLRLANALVVFLAVLLPLMLVLGAAEGTPQRPTLLFWLLLLLPLLVLPWLWRTLEPEDAADGQTVTARRIEQMESLLELGFVERRENVVFLGPSGVGKTHLAISLAIAAAQHGRRVYYGTLADLITSLEEAQASGRLQARLKALTHPALLVVDEIGYLPISRTGAMLFFQLMTRRYEHASTVLTSNKGFEDWGEIFGDDVMAEALIDRLVHHCHIVTIRGNSFRMRQHTDLWHVLHTAQEPEPSGASAGGRVRRWRRTEPSPRRTVRFSNGRNCQILARR